MKIKRVLFDMDGVLVDFDKGLRELTESFQLPPIPEAQWDIFPDKRYDVVREHISTKAEWWENLDPISTGLRAFNLFNIMDQLVQPTYVCSSPGFPISATPKVTWCKMHLQVQPARVILCERKHLFANADNLLIDDRADICNTFISEGGNAILVKQPWSLNLLGNVPLHKDVRVTSLDNLTDLLVQLHNERVL